MNQENYKKAVNQIHASKGLKNKTLEKITKQKKQSKVIYFKYATVCATIVLVFSTGLLYFNKWKNSGVQTIIEENRMAKAENNLPRFENMEQLRKALKQSKKSKSNLKGIIADTDAVYESSETTKGDELDYSTTNVQVENVEEADIVKTDGKYIYYIANGKVYIVQASNLKIMTNIEIEKDNERFYPKEIYVKENRLIVLGNSSEYRGESQREYDEDIIEDSYQVTSRYMAKAFVYDISNKKEVKQIREIGLDGNYVQSRMIGDNLYWISSKSLNYDRKMKDEDILPIVEDTASREITKKIECTDIAYFEGTECYSYMIVAGFNVYQDKELNTETFFGASDTVYVSEENLYITQAMNKDENVIYKFNMKDSQIQLKCKGEIKGYLKNQFSMDEYEGNLRIATTSNDGEESTNQLYVLDENLNEIGKIENLAKDEKIYSVRFIGKVGYMVTFKQIDPLFVIDLSDPMNPAVKGELKIPGYSSYLHPYDETHIIGIGYNTKTNQYGGVTNSNMKMSMFDVSDLENPKEMFHIDMGEENVYSEITRNHKALFYHKDKNLIGFPIRYRETDSKSRKNALAMYKIDLEKGFEKYGEIEQSMNYKTNINRAIYVGDKLYTLSNTEIVLYDLNTVEKIEKLELD